ncbi:MAG: hypothetical protein ACFFCI_01065 [Promethearchaeota archaeon]
MDSKQTENIKKQIVQLELFWTHFLQMANFYHAYELDQFRNSLNDLNHIIKNLHDEMNIETFRCSKCKGILYRALDNYNFFCPSCGDNNFKKEVAWYLDEIK